MHFDPYTRWLKIPPDRRPPTYYDLLGLRTGETDERRIHQAAQDRYDHVRKYTFGPAGPARDRAQGILDELSEALSCLANPTLRREYDRRLRAGQAGAKPGTEAGVDLRESMRSLLDEALGPADQRSPARARGPSRRCPDCRASLIPGAVLCVRCGTDLRTGEKLSTFVGEEEDVPGIGALLQAAWSSLWQGGQPGDRGAESLDEESLKPMSRRASAAWTAGTIGGLLLIMLALTPMVLRFIAHAQMDGIVRDLQYKMAPRLSTIKKTVGLEGNIPAAAREFAPYLRHAPSYFAKLESGEGRAANKKRYLVQQIILALPPDTNLKPLRKVPKESFAYGAAQQVLRREGDPPDGAEPAVARGEDDPPPEEEQDPARLDDDRQEPGPPQTSSDLQRSAPTEPDVSGLPPDDRESEQPVGFDVEDMDADGPRTREPQSPPFWRRRRGRPVGERPAPSEETPRPDAFGAAGSGDYAPEEGESDQGTSEAEAKRNAPRSRHAFRMWTDDSGSYQVKAAFVFLAGDKVRLRKEDGTTIDLPRDRLSEADREWIRRLTR
jgi:hypothetical protein